MSPEPMTWHPIETAPKDGTEVDLWGQGRRYPNMRWHLEWQLWSSRQGRLVYEPTHWMKLPEPPT